MGFLGAALIALGVVGLIYGIMQRLKAGRVTDAPLATTGDVVSRGAAVAGPKGQISAQGTVMCQQPLYSPVTGTPCLFYELKVKSEWKDGDTVKTHELEHQKVAAQFAINDGSGPVWVDLRQGGDFEPTQKKEQEQETGLLKGIVGGELMFGNYRLQAGIGNIGTKYTVTEEVLPMQQSVYVCGKLGEGGMITAPGWRNLIVSNKTRDQLLADSTKTSKIALGVGGGGLLVGIILVVVSSMMGPSAAEIQAEADAAAAAASAAAAAAASAAATDMPAADPSASATATAAVPAKKGVTSPTKATTTATATAAATSTGVAPAATTAAPAATTTAATRPTASAAVTAPKPGIIIKPKK